MKKIFLFALFSVAFIMCKSTSAVPAEELLSFVVILEGDATPINLKSDLSYNQVNFEEGYPSENQWIVNYGEGIEKEKQIKAALLNHPKVLSAFTKAQFVKLKDKSKKDVKTESLGKKAPTKQ